jgi:hypothetical protein
MIVDVDERVVVLVDPVALEPVDPEGLGLGLAEY